jgi:hypothetical protein
MVSQPNGLARIHPKVERLTLLVSEMDRRAAERGMQNVAELCRTCVGVVPEMQVEDATPTDKDLEVLKHLGMAIRAALYPANSNTGLAQGIIKTVAAR